jgi:hypothetical protein
LDDPSPLITQLKSLLDALQIRGIILLEQSQQMEARMTKFVKEHFSFSGPYVHYDGKFIARFKYNHGASRTYATFLVKHFTVEEFFALQEAHEAAQRSGEAHKPGYEGGTYKTAENRGYLMPHIKRWLRDAGYEVSQAGYKQMIADQVAKHYKPAEAA